MRRLGLIVAAALVAAFLGYFLVGLHYRRDALARDVRGTDLAWIRAEFAMSDDQFAAIQQLHDRYAGQCARHCADIMAARSRLDALRAGAADSVELAEAERRLVELEATCNDATRAHLRRVAAAMPPAQGERFLHAVEPHLAQMPHDGGRGLAD